MSAAIETVGLSKTFGETAAVEHLDLQVERGQVFGFLGPNGAGKTTTIRMRLDLCHPSSGRACSGSTDAATASRFMRAAPISPASSSCIRG